MEILEIVPFVSADVEPDEYAVMNVALPLFTTTTTLSPSLISESFALSPLYITVTDELTSTFFSVEPVFTVIELLLISVTVPITCSFTVGFEGFEELPPLSSL